ncbi:hypothetical protein GTO27_02145 [Candidatus Bathyarchaeota archaeon]|nr:hypothetical protein [Candidatus Bathyarchaeota archaeon]
MLPELVYGFHRERLDFTGYLVIDSTIENKSCGGVRVSPSVTLDEVRKLARNMTLKYGFLGIPSGGAKAGIKTNGILSREKKKLIIAEFGKALSRFIENGYFIPGTDMGTSEEDINWLMNAAKERRSSSVSVKSGHGSEYTGWTIVNSARQATKLENASVAIQGFGKIGSSVARIFSENGAKIVAVSTCNGTIHNPKGLETDRLISCRDKYGDDLVKAYHDCRRMPRDHLFELPVDILLPCAGSYLINSTNAHKIKAKVICPGANIPLTDQAEQVLFKRGIICIPDFVSNSGAVLGNYMANYVNRTKIKKIIDEEFSQAVCQLLKISRERNIYPKGLAIQIAVRRFYETKKKGRRLQRLLLRGIRIALPDAYEKIILKPVASHMFRRLLKRTFS